MNSESLRIVEMVYFQSSFISIVHDTAYNILQLKECSNNWNKSAAIREQML